MSYVCENAVVVRGGSRSRRRRGCGGGIRACVLKCMHRCVSMRVDVSVRLSACPYVCEKNGTHSEFASLLVDLQHGKHNRLRQVSPNQTLDLPTL